MNTETFLLQVDFSYDPEVHDKPSIYHVNGFCGISDLQQIQLAAEELECFDEIGSYLFNCECYQDSNRDSVTGEYTIDSWWELTLIEKRTDEIPEPTIVDVISKFSLDSSKDMYSGITRLRD